VIVSGLARGIDAAAHRGALAAGGATVAVLPAGLARITPPEHTELADAIARRGALVSEWEASIAPLPGRFVERNRLIAALAAVTVVVEAATRSGGLVTAAVARRLGRPVLAVPGDLDRPTVQGCVALLRAGASVCAGAGDVLAALARAPGRAPASPRGSSSRARAPRRALAAHGAAETPEARLLTALGGAPVHVEPLARAAGLELSEALAALLRLEWAGAVSALPGQRWRRAKDAGA